MSLNRQEALYEIQRLTGLLQSARDERDYAIKKAEEKWVAADARLEQARMLEGKSFKDENDGLKSQNKRLLEENEALKDTLREIADKVSLYAVSEGYGY